MVVNVARRSHGGLPRRGAATHRREPELEQVGVAPPAGLENPGQVRVAAVLAVRQEVDGREAADSASVNQLPRRLARTPCAVGLRLEVISGPFASLPDLLTAIDGDLKSGTDLTHALVGQAAEPLDQDIHRHTLDGVQVDGATPRYWVLVGFQYYLAGQASDRGRTGPDQRPSHPRDGGVAGQNHHGTTADVGQHAPPHVATPPCPLGRAGRPNDSPRLPPLVLCVPRRRSYGGDYPELRGDPLTHRDHSDCR